MKTKTDIDNGKYTIVHDNGTCLQVLRYGEPWATELTGHKFTLSVAQEVDTLRADKVNLCAAVDKLLADHAKVAAEKQNLCALLGKELANVIFLGAEVAEYKLQVKNLEEMVRLLTAKPASRVERIPSPEALAAKTRVVMRNTYARKQERTCPHCGRELDEDQPTVCDSDDCPRHDTKL